MFFLLRLELERRKKGLTQVALGRKAAVRNQDICAIEKGKMVPSTDVLDRLAGVLNISPSSVLLNTVGFQDETEVNDIVTRYEEARRAAALVRR